MSFYRSFIFKTPPSLTEQMRCLTNTLAGETDFSLYPWKYFADKEQYLMIYHSQYEFLAPVTETALVAQVWVADLSRYFCLRKGELRLPSGEVALRTEQDWILYDRKNQALVPWEKPWVSTYGKWTKDSPTLSRTSRVKGDFHPIRTGTVRSDDLDENQHVNNNVYLQWILASLDQNISLHTWSVTYHRELHLGDYYCIEALEDEPCIHLKIYGPNKQLTLRSTITRRK